MIDQIAESVPSPQSSDISVHPRASAADCNDVDILQELRALLLKRWALTISPEPVSEPNRYDRKSDYQIVRIALNIATRTLRDEIRELEIRRSRGLPPEPRHSCREEGAADERR